MCCVLPASSWGGLSSAAAEEPPEADYDTGDVGFDEDLESLSGEEVEIEEVGEGTSTFTFHTDGGDPPGDYHLEIFESEEAAEEQKERILEALEMDYQAIEHYEAAKDEVVDGDPSRWTCTEPTLSEDDHGRYYEVEPDPDFDLYEDSRTGEWRLQYLNACKASLSRTVVATGQCDPV